ncbi:MAG TPA: hypothetical protein VHV10_02650 [Ktedonobacteraceae bacterium]|jgi:hypothetical protein|nr:hypothetical protein [Ktedonobacteraceae bacterium]
MIKTATLANLDAFCGTCPPVREVTALLETLGFHLSFQAAARKFSSTYLLPAQYHYIDEYGTEVNFLAGRDHEEGRWVPVHFSRFWVYGGSSPYAYNLVKQTLSTQWDLAWRKQ